MALPAWECVPTAMSQFPSSATRSLRSELEAEHGVDSFTVLSSRTRPVTTARIGESASLRREMVLLGQAPFICEFSGVEPRPRGYRDD